MAHIPRLYVPGRLGPGPLSLSEEQTRRLTAVMRLRAGDEFRVFAGDGREWRATVTTAGKQSLKSEVHAIVRQEALPARTVEVWCAMVRPNRFDWAIEKCVEAGADIFRPLVTAHSARGEGASATRQERWERIAVEAMEQCGRLHPAVVDKPTTFAQALERLHGALVLLDSSGRPWTDVASLLPERGGVALAIGPEGGWSEDELRGAKASGALVGSLGPHILRTETAAVVGTALLRAL